MVIVSFRDSGVGCSQATLFTHYKISKDYSADCEAAFINLITNLLMFEEVTARSQNLGPYRMVSSIDILCFNIVPLEFSALYGSTMLKRLE